MTVTAPSPGETSLLRQLASTDPLDVVPRLTLVLVVSHAQGLTGMLAVLGAAIAAVDRRVYRSPWLWLGIATFRGAHELTDWHGVDDHVVVITYWCLALGLVFCFEGSLELLADAGRLLVGLVMGFATFWKLTSGEFLDGTFFEHTLVTDPRFAFWAEHIGGMSPAGLAANQVAIDAMEATGSDLTAITLATTPRVGLLAVVLTAGTIAVEGLLTLVFLGRSPTLVGLRVPALLAFCAVTYLLVPVSLFGLILVAMTYAGTPAGGQRRALLVAVPALVVLGPLWTWATGISP